MNFSGLTVFEKIGQGGQAAIFRCADNSGAEFALKVFNRKPGFDREVALLSRLGNHENVMGFCASSNDSNWPQLEVDNKIVEFGILFPFAVGGSLDNFVNKNKLSSVQMHEIIEQLVAAVKHVHSLGFAHRDIKPENILVTQVSPLKVALADFGLSKQFNAEDSIVRKVERDGTQEICLTDPWYVCPELYNEQQNAYLASADMWSLGVTIWEAVCKKQFIKTRELKDFQDNCVFSMKKEAKGKNKFVTERLMMLHHNQVVPLPAKRAVRNLLDLNPEKRDLDTVLACVACA